MSLDGMLTSDGKEMPRSVWWAYKACERPACLLLLLVVVSLAALDQMALGFNGMDKIEELQRHENTEINEQAMKITSHTTVCTQPPPPSPLPEHLSSSYGTHDSPTRQ